MKKDSNKAAADDLVSALIEDYEDYKRCKHETDNALEKYRERWDLANQIAATSESPLKEVIDEALDDLSSKLPFAYRDSQVALNNNYKDLFNRVKKIRSAY